MAWLIDSWVNAEPHIQRAVDRAGGCFDINHVWSEIATGKAQLWPGDGSAIVTKIETHPSGLKSLLIWLAGGELEEVFRLTDKAEAWAKSMGCTRGEYIGREGFARGRPEYRKICSVFVKEI
jgi:hypothetical protein